MKTSQTMVDLDALQTQVVDLCREAGDFIRREASGFDRSKIEFKKVFNNLVSYVDKETEKILVERLSAMIPESGFITEEGTIEKSEAGAQEYQWIIDPLDGTTNFLHGMPVYAISIALTRHNKVVLGAVYEINKDECFYAAGDGPAYLNGKEISVSSITDLSESLLATGFPYYHSNNQEPYLAIIRTFLNDTHGIRRLGSAAVDLAYVACGRIEGFFEYNLNPWDVAAGAFIVQQAGGVVTDFGGGNNFMFGRELCAAGGVHPQMLDIIQAKWF